MLTQEARLKGNKIGTTRLKEKALVSIGAEAITKMVEYKKQGLSLRKIADKLNHAGYRTMTGKEFQQAQVKRTLDRLKKNPQLMNTVTPSKETVTTLTDSVTSRIESVTTPRHDKEQIMLLAELEKYKAKVEALHVENERLQQVDIEEELAKNKLKELKEAIKPFQDIVQNNKNPNQPRLKKMGELLAAIEKHLV